MKMVKSENEGYGFYSTMALDGCADTAWDTAMLALTTETGAEPDHVRAFLDSTWGRHFADDVHCALRHASLDQAVAAAIVRWQGWTLSRRTRRELGIPTPMRYLDGMVYAAAAYAEAI